MRRLKRDPMERAFLRGYQHGIHGKSRDLCPFSHPEVRQAWINGWREGRVEGPRRGAVEQSSHARYGALAHRVRYLPYRTVLVQAC